MSQKHRVATLAVMIVVIVTALSLTVVSAGFAQQGTPSTTTTAADMSFADIYNQVSPSVVAISVTLKPDTTTTTLLTPFGQPQQQGAQHALGSGFVLDASGHIVTNDHVVNNATSIEIAFQDGTLARASVVGMDPDSDIAVLQVENVPTDELHPVALGNSDNLYVGQTVLAIGSPFGERWTLTSGIVSGLNRVIHALDDFSIGGAIQTDASINPGNSGGPLLNMQGQVVGVNAQIATDSGSNSGVGFAIPIDLVQRVADALIQQGYVEYSYLGISGTNIDLDAIEALSLPSNTRGVLVGDVTPGSPAARAGIQAMQTTTDDSGNEKVKSADVITAIDAQPIYGMEDLISYLASSTEPGQTATLTVLRGSDTLSLDVQLTPRPHTTTS